jgi:hypothetical protein
MTSSFYVRLDKVANYASIDALPADAIRTLEDAAQHNVESAPEWYANLQRTVFRDDPGVCYYVKHHEDGAAAIMPVRHAKHGFIRQIEALGNFYTSLYTLPLSESGDLAPLLLKASRAKGQAHVMRFAPLDPATPAYAALFTAMRSIGWIPFKYFCFGNWHLEVTCPWREYLQQRPGRLRNTLRRKSKKFAAAGGKLEIITGGVALDAAIADYNAVYARSWKRPELFPEFVPELVRWLAAKGWLRLGLARLEGQAIAAQIWIVAHGKASIFKLAYDEHFAEYAAGTLLTAHLMEHAIDRERVREVDYLIGDDPYKADWMSQRRERWGIVAYNPKTVIGLGLLMREALGRLVRKLNSKGVCRDTRPKAVAARPPATSGVDQLSERRVVTEPQHSR